MENINIISLTAMISLIILISLGLKLLIRRLGEKYGFKTDGLEKALDESSKEAIEDIENNYEKKLAEKKK